MVKSTRKRKRNRPTEVDLANVSRSSEIKNFILLNTIATLLIVGNPGFLFAGTVIRNSLMAAGGLLLISSIIINCIYNKKNAVAVFQTLTAACLIESFQYFRGQDVFTLFNVTFRIILYIAFLAGQLSLAPNGSFISKIQTNRLWLILTFLSLIIGAGYFFSLRATSGMTGGRQVADDSLNPVGIAYVFGSVFVISILASISIKGWVARIAAYLSSALSIYILIGTGSRGALISAIIAIFLLFIIFALKSKAARPRLAAFIVVGTSAGLFLWVRASEQIAFMLSRFDSLTYGSDRSSNIRMDNWDIYLAKFDEWILLGYSDYSSSTYPHNLFFELLMRFGLIGILLSFGVVRLGGYLCVDTLKKPSREKLLIFSLFIFSFINSLTSLSIEMNRWLVLSLGTSFGIMCAYRDSKHNRQLISELG